MVSGTLHKEHYLFCESEPSDCLIQSTEISSVNSSLLIRPIATSGSSDISFEDGDLYTSEGTAASLLRTFTQWPEELGWSELVSDRNESFVSTSREDALLGQVPRLSISNDGMAAPAVLDEVVKAALEQIQTFVLQSDSAKDISRVFGNEGATPSAFDLLLNVVSGRKLPAFEVLPFEQLRAKGAFGNDTVYLSEELLNSANADDAIAVVIEELGHYIDSQLNSSDSQGDEGALFATLVQNKPLSDAELLALKSEDDSAQLTINGNTFAVEQAFDEAGIFTVGQSGTVTVDFLLDSGSYVSELGLFSLRGLENLDPTSQEFIQNAASRAISNSGLGYIAISDTTEGGRLNGRLPSDGNYSRGDYLGPKEFALLPGEQFAFILVPNGTLEEVATNPAIQGNKAPIFSIASANPNGTAHIGQLVTGVSDGQVFGFEDIRTDGSSDLDYNDIIFQVTGASAQAISIASLINLDEAWSDSDIARQIYEIAENAQEEFPFEIDIDAIPDLDILDEPIEVAPGIFLLGTGPSLDDFDFRGPFNASAADTTNADQLQVAGDLGLNLTGSGVNVGVWDVGSARNTHQEFGGRVSIGRDIVDVQTPPPSFGDHATHVTGTIAAAGVVPEARGMAVGVSVQSYDTLRDLEEMNRDAPFLQISNHSYGLQDAGWFGKGPLDLRDGLGVADTWFTDATSTDILADLLGLAAVESSRFGRYTVRPQLIDNILFNNPNLLSIWAAGNERNNAFGQAQRQDGLFRLVARDPNDPNRTQYFRINSALFEPPSDGNGGSGFDSLTSFDGQTAKNTLVVGAINDITVDPFDRDSAVSASFSSWGPTDDGRLKPDVVGNGVEVLSTLAESDTAYKSSNGTSMAAPNVTGTAALLYEHFRNLYGFFPNSATGKGILIHTAKDVGNVGPDYRFGWGVVDGAAAAKFITSANANGNVSTAPNLLIEDSYSGAVRDFVVESDGSSSLKATIVWTDPPGALPAPGLDNPTPVLVNNLDLVIIGPDGTVYNPWTLNKDDPSAPAIRIQANNLDNVEQVLIDAPAAGTYTIRVGNRSGLVFNQAYSLLVSTDPEVLGTTGDDIPFEPDPVAPVQPTTYNITVSGTTLNNNTFFLDEFFQNGQLVVGPTIGTFSGDGPAFNGVNEVEVGISAGIPFYGTDGSLAFATNTLLLPFIGAPSFFDGFPATDNSFVDYDPFTRTLSVIVDPTFTSTTGNPGINSFVAQDAFVNQFEFFPNSPKSILAGDLILQFSEDFNSVFGTARFTGQTNGSFFVDNPFTYEAFITGTRGFSTFG